MRKKTTQRDTQKTTKKIALYKPVRKEKPKLRKGMIRKKSSVPRETPQSSAYSDFSNSSNPFQTSVNDQKNELQTDYSGIRSGKKRIHRETGRKNANQQENKRAKTGRPEIGRPGTNHLKPFRKNNAFKKRKIRSFSSKSANFSRSTKASQSQTKPLHLVSQPQQQRLQKVLASAGFGSRRTCEELITSGRVEVDHKVVNQLGTQVDPNHNEIAVDGEPIKRTKPIYLALFKPKGYLCTNQDEKGRRRAIDLIPESFGRLFPVGRLDMNSEGLLLLTNDGDMAERLTHPKYGVPKIYRVQVAGTVDQRVTAQLKKGVYLAEGLARADRVVIKRHYKQSTILEITLKEGRNREIRRLLAHIGHKVLTLRRISVGPIKLGKMLPGDYRILSNQEVRALK